MKFFSAVTMTILLLVFTSCGTAKSKKQVFFSGIIRPAGITSYQYGTHTLKTEKELFAIKSDSINLDSFTGKDVRVRANKIKGYPLDGGPVYLNVNQVEN
ncbi:MAG: hypothetical protein WB492_03920 [Christiangramia sp.]